MDQNTLTTPSFSHSLCSGEPWNLVIRVDSVGRDLLVRIEGGEAHIGAVAVAQLQDGRVETSQIVLGIHKEGPIATHAAHQIAREAECTVTSVAGIHFDNISKGEIQALVADAYGLSARMARLVGDWRRRSEANASGSFGSELRARGALRISEVQEFFARPIVELLEQYRPILAGHRQAHFGDRVMLFAPLYLSSACPNDCSYCGFRRSADFKRIQLPVDQAVSEAIFLGETGFRTLDLVTGEIPTDSFVDYVCRVTEGILKKSAIEKVNLNLGALSFTQYRRLREAGGYGYHLYQETYDPDTYFSVHLGGAKREMEKRLAASVAAAEAGFPVIGLGALLGLRPVAEDLACLVEHAHYLREQFPNLQVGFSIPRIQDVDASCDYEVAEPVSDDLFRKVMLYLRVACPEAHLTLTTRESEALRNDLLPFGVTKMSAGVSTAPGGYTEYSHEDREQFSISDLRSLAEVEGFVRSLGLQPVFS